MSRFLTRLVARSRGERPTVRPRLPSLFEDLPAVEPEEAIVEDVAEDAVAAPSLEAMPAPVDLLEKGRL